MFIDEETLETKTDKNIEKIQTSSLEELKNTLDNIFDISTDLIEHPLQLKTNTSIFVQNATRKVDVTFQNGKFVFNLDINANVALVEKTK
ncbi:hypothetical protein COI92_30505 [Bacillus anthracis]|nr:hypothetical protein COI92_30505 [Bacillus anthracis]